jgi:dTDP-4-dehydrorhamnose 3,5-epimerase
MGKLMQVINGSAYLVAVDIRPDSPTFLQHHAIVADDRNNLQVWASAGFARGYYTFEPNTIVLYSCDEYVGADQAIRWDDPTIGIDWPTRSDRLPILSERDSHAQTIQEYLKQ